MEPAGQAANPGEFVSAVAGEGLHAADRSPPEAPRAGPAGAECREGESQRQDQPRPPRALVRGAQQTPGRQSRCSGVSRPLAAPVLHHVEASPAC